MEVRNGQWQVTAGGVEPCPTRSTWKPALFDIFVNDHNKKKKCGGGVADGIF